MQGTCITLYPEKKQAVLRKRQPMAVSAVSGGPFQQFQKMLKDGNLKWLERRTLPTGDVVNIFRNSEWDEDNRIERNYDLWIDAESKHLVRVNFHGPRGELYNSEKDPIRNNPIGNGAYSFQLMGWVYHDIIFNAKVDKSLFDLQPPEGYTVKYEQEDRMTEENILEYLRAFVEFHDGTFPDRAFPPYMNLDKLNAAQHKRVRDLTWIEKKYVDLFKQYHRSRISSPFDFFDRSGVVENSFRYLGRGVKLGDKSAIVCWYQLKDAKDPKVYRVVFGDLSVKDVDPKDLPLRVER